LLLARCFCCSISISNKYKDTTSDKRTSRKFLAKQSIQKFTEKKPITDYLIISQDRDTTFVDTTLSVAKQYKFNFRRKDDFEHLAFANSGQTVNYLSMQSGPKSILPMPGFRAKSHQMFQPHEVSYYHVPTPLTEMYFKTAFQQGQSTDVLITANLRKMVG